MYQIIIFGKASNSTIKESFIPTDSANQFAMNWLKTEKIPIASSCDGEGICKKCIINENKLSCQIKLIELLTSDNIIRIEIAYL